MWAKMVMTEKKLELPMDEIEKLYLEPTSACNLRCNMCFRHNWIDEVSGLMPRSVVEKVVQLPKQLPHLKTVMIAGMGEPLLHPKISQIVAAFANRGVNTQLLTNGTLLSRTMADELLKAGLSMLWISVDGFNRSSYEKVHIGSQFDLITENLRYFDNRRGNCKLGITFVITMDNQKDLARINDFADQYHAQSINLSYEIPCAAVQKEASCYDKGHQIGKQHRIDLGKSVGRITDHCPFIAENGCFVKWDGDICPCMQLLHNSYSFYYEEKRKIMGKSFGNIKRDDLQAIWRQPDYTDFRRRVRNFEFPDCTICMGCEDRWENMTDCMYNDFPTCGACLWAQGNGRCP